MSSTASGGTDANATAVRFRQSFPTLTFRCAEEAAMKTLFVMFDAHCGLCAEVRDWLESEPAYLPLRLLASDSDEARRTFPGLPAGELAVVSDGGDVWLGD